MKPPPSHPVARVIPISPIKGRGTSHAIAHRFAAEARNSFDDGWDTLDALAGDTPLPPRTQIIHENAKTILSKNDSPDIPFTYSINPYRGCEHGCIYCYARPTHSYLNLSPGLDFETKIIAKLNAAACLERELSKPTHVPSPINIGSATDAYQPIERELKITRSILEVLNRCAHPYTIITKSGGVERDLDLIAQAAQREQAAVFISLTTLNPALARVLEPRAAAPARRLQSVGRLAQAGIPVGVNVAPIIPFLNEPEIERLVEAAASAGARSIHWTVLRLPWEVAPLFKEWLEQHQPGQAKRIMARVHDLRGGKDYDARYALRMKGQGLWADLIRQRMDQAIARCGLARSVAPLSCAHFKPPGQTRQGLLF